jgi:prepilin-type N-terminal cleavage/methylation domain-containing protein
MTIPALFKKQKYFSTLKYKNNFSSHGFTLIELLVVSALVVLLLLSVSSMFMTYLVSNAQTNIRRQIKSEGNQMVSQLEFLFRSAQSVNYQSSGLPITCNNNSFSLSSNPLVIKDADNNQYTISFSTQKVIVQNGTNPANELNSTYVVPSAPTITCYGNTTSQNKSIKIDFTLEWQSGGSFTDSFSTTIQLRNT